MKIVAPQQVDRRRWLFEGREAVGHCLRHAFPVSDSGTFSGLLQSINEQSQIGRAKEGGSSRD